MRRRLLRLATTNLPLMTDERKSPARLSGKIVPRAIELLFPGEQLCCPKGHKLKHRAWASGSYPMLAERCDYSEPPGNTGVCGLIVYWIKLPGDMRILAEITSSEAHAMESERMGVEQIFELIGLRSWRRDVAKAEA